jgi:hypothetical protein
MVKCEVATSDRLDVSFAVTRGIVGEVGERSEVNGSVQSEGYRGEGRLTLSIVEGDSVGERWRGQDRLMFE